jgi:acyl-CoA reductase-like NAD-dependent aldehyde dehydrogenase
MGPVYAVTGLFLMAASITGQAIFSPTVLTNVDPANSLTGTEIFGPVVDGE